MCDVDGTLALMNGRSPYDPSRYMEDLPNQPIIDIVCSLTEPGNSSLPALVVVSGRDDTYKGVTLEWLTKYWIFPDEIFMRKAGDKRKDYIVKEEIYHRHIEPKYNVVAVFDDRQQCVDLWRRLGLPALQVAPGDF